MGRPPFHPGDRIQNYVIDKEFIVGPLGAIYTVKGKDILLKAPFLDAGKAIEKFRKEANILKKLQHPNILGILDCDLENAIPWITLEKLSEGTLRQAMENGPISVVTALRWMFQITQAIGYGHSQSEPLLHRQIRPENICFRNQQPMILDWGLTEFGSTSGVVFPNEANILYQAPELFDLRNKLDLHAEVYALGVIFYELLAGHPPFGSIEQIYDEEQRIKIIEQIVNPQEPIPRITDLPKLLPRILQKSLHRSPSYRYTNAESILSDIRTVFKDVLVIEATKAEEQGDFAKSLSLLEEALSIGLDEKIYNENRQRLLSQQNSNLDKFIIQAKQFRVSLRNLLQIFNMQIDLASQRKIIRECLEISDDAKDWQILQQDLRIFHKSLLSYLPKPVSLFFSNIEKEPTLEITPPTPEPPPLSPLSSTAIRLSASQTMAKSSSEPSAMVLSVSHSSPMPALNVSPTTAFSIEEPSQKKISSVIPSLPSLKSPAEEINSNDPTHSEKYSPKVIVVDDGSYQDDDAPTIVIKSLNLDDDQPKVSQKTGEPDKFADDEEIIITDTNKPQTTETLTHPNIVLPDGFTWIDHEKVLCQKDGSEMIYIPCGTFIMGSEAIHAFDVEKPEHEVFLDDYFIDINLITWKQYFKFCEEMKQPKPEIPEWGSPDDHPVVNITWDQAQKYAVWAGKTIPTEAQWEKAARGGVWLDGDQKKRKRNPKPRRTYPWGDDSPNAGGIWRANYNAEPKFGKNRGAKSTSPIGYFTSGKSPYNVMDMAGNVWEWVQDWFASDYYKRSPRHNPLGPDIPESGHEDDTPGRVLRGGSWYIGSRLLRVTARRKRPPEGLGASCGMRCVLAII